ncbi:MAG: hypothetical protein WCQ00_03585 [bacterium]
MTGEIGAKGVIVFLISFINGVVGFIIGLTLVVFIWGLFKLIFASSDSKERETAKGYIVWGIISLAIMVSVWGLVNLLTSSFGFGSVTPMVPGFPNTSIF